MKILKSSDGEQENAGNGGDSDDYHRDSIVSSGRGGSIAAKEGTMTKEEKEYYFLPRAVVESR